MYNNESTTPQRNDEFGGGGHSLGGAAGAAMEHLSPSEIRQRRLAAFEGANRAGTTMAVPPPASNPTPTSTASPTAAGELPRQMECELTPTVDEADDNDELQAALAMSLQPPEDDAPQTPLQQQRGRGGGKENTVATRMEATTTTTTTPLPSSMSNPNTGGHLKTEPDESDDAEWWKSSDVLDISAFHSIMWDSMMTTDNDKSRWVGQGISTRDSTSSSTTVSGSLATNNPDASASLLTIVGSDHGPWGLTQAHGGPCGVLAAVQAELLRLLLFGRRHDTLFYPTELVEEEKARPATYECISEDLVRRGLAMSIAIILARAALMPSAATGEDNNYNRKGGAAGGKSDTSGGGGGGDACVKVVLPSYVAPTGLTWDDLEPWSPPTVITTTTMRRSPKLRVYTVSNTTATDNTSPKRQKKNSPGQHVSRGERMIRLANAVTSFLLHPPPPSNNNIQDESHRDAPLESFRRPGGVILLVMSLVCSRGHETIQSDMDDPTGTKLTSQFGHCSQELINLLLTGQAVSNVFDNTLTPSGALTCRGIQNRPSVGYLSQLESLRYCEVGGYYKSPNFPIWVVGSTSHFTVLFGDANCLKESKSDVLLEKCRRAFKAVEGGEENGFISTASLGKVLLSLNVDVGGQSGVQTLAASLEVSGAGIILWDDFWKATSRLLTGASLASVLEGRDGRTSGNVTSSTSTSSLPLLITQHGEATSTDASSTPAAARDTISTMESDEELAKRLAAEWGTGDASAATTTTTTAGAVARPPSPMDIDNPAGMSDEEYARKLQAQWDAEMAGGSSANDSIVIDGDDNATTQAVATAKETAESSLVNSTDAATELPASAAAATAGDAPPKLEFEQFGDSFPLYHYNGLRGGSLTPFRVTRLSAEEAVGATIALSTHSSGSGARQTGSGGGDLEDVVRTKWPSCTINWLGNHPPYID